MGRWNARPWLKVLANARDFDYNGVSGRGGAIPPDECQLGFLQNAAPTEEPMGRGLSPVQNEIMQVAQRQGFITPHDAVECSFINVSPFGNPIATASAIASRSLRRLVARGLLVYDRALWRRHSDVYRLAGWYGPTPRLPRPSLANFHERMEADLGAAMNAMARAAGQG